MSTFLKVNSDLDKGALLKNLAFMFRNQKEDKCIFDIETAEFSKIPGSPFVYWLKPEIISIFNKIGRLSDQGVTGKQGLGTADDFRFVRNWWEIVDHSGWKHYAKGGKNKSHYADLHLKVSWHSEGDELREIKNSKGIPKSNIWMLEGAINEFFFKPGITWASRPHVKGTFCILPKNSIFSVMGMAMFPKEVDDIFFISAVVNSKAFLYLLHCIIPRGGEDSGQTLVYEITYIFSTPFLDFDQTTRATLSDLAKSAWSAARKLDIINETSHAFVAPRLLIEKLHPDFLANAEMDYHNFLKKIDAIVFDGYGFSEGHINDQPMPETDNESIDAQFDWEDDKIEKQDDDFSSLISWCVGVAFCRFDLQLANGNRRIPENPDPLDELPIASPAMLIDEHSQNNIEIDILVDDPNNQFDLIARVENIFLDISIECAKDIRHWIRKDFFAFHIQSYTKSRRKTPIYWPLSTPSGSYTIWINYTKINNQTLYSAVNNFIDPKLRQVDFIVSSLRAKASSRTKEDEREFESAQALMIELINLRDNLLKIAPIYKINHNDGVEISAAPLWPLIHHKPWQKILKEAWSKLEKGDYDWAHLAMNNWPERVRDKCKTDKSLAIAHGLEHMYVEPEAQPKKPRGRKKAGGNE